MQVGDLVYKNYASSVDGPGIIVDSYEESWHDEIKDLLHRVYVVSWPDGSQSSEIAEEIVTFEMRLSSYEY